MSVTLRPATVDDLPIINGIYNHYVQNSTATYQTVLNTAEQRRWWFDIHGPKHPVLVAVEENEVLGWGSLSRLHERQAFAHTVEDSVYIHPDRQGRGLGKLLLAELIRLAREIGHHTVLASISADQEASLALHAKFGFEKVAHMREVGYKFDRWLDVVWMQKMV